MENTVELTPFILVEYTDPTEEPAALIFKAEDKVTIFFRYVAYKNTRRPCHETIMFNSTV
jgi:hypothetical protein